MCSPRGTRREEPHGPKVLITLSLAVYWCGGVFLCQCGGVFTCMYGYV